MLRILQVNALNRKFFVLLLITICFFVGYYYLYSSTTIFDKHENSFLQKQKKILFLFQLFVICYSLYLSVVGLKVTVFRMLKNIPEEVAYIISSFTTIAVSYLIYNQMGIEWSEKNKDAFQYYWFGASTISIALISFTVESLLFWRQPK